MSGADWTPATWLGTAEQCESIRQWARDYPWEERIEDPEHAADTVLADLGELHPDARARLRAALVESAEAAR